MGHFNTLNIFTCCTWTLYSKAYYCKKANNLKKNYKAKISKKLSNIPDYTRSNPPDDTVIS